LTTNQRENRYWDLRHDLELIGGVTQKKFKCWGHEDRTASATASLGSDGRILINCHAGCRVEDILAARGYEMKDLYPPDQDKRPSKPKQRGKFETEYFYLPDLKNSSSETLTEANTVFGSTKRVIVGSGGAMVWKLLYIATALNQIRYLFQRAKKMYLR
jgi:hypothetical protein